MKLKLTGHGYKYAVEQILLSMFPGEKPEYSFDTVIGSCELIVESVLSYGAVYAQGTTVIHCGGKVYRGVARVGLKRLSNKLLTDRFLQRVVKQSFFRAAVKCTGTQPVWGSLTGIRPAKLASAALESGASEKSASNMLSREYYVSKERADMCVRAAGAALDLKKKIKPGDVALYVGIPFCPTRCAYCSFVSNSVEKSHGLIEPFVEVLLREIRAMSDLVSELGLRVITVYIGGGTPTALPDAALESVMATLQSSFDFSGAGEYTVEAGRPDTITPNKLGIISKYGAGRVSVNPQSMSGHVLSAIGRRHTPEDVLNAVHFVRQNKMALNMDIISGLPRDDPEGFGSTLDAVLGLNPENITVHTLSLKKGSRIMLEGTELPDGADVAAMLGYASRKLSGGGYRPYYLYRQKFTSGGFENTGWSLPGYEGVYNICMMEELCTVLALGGGGVTKIVSPGGKIERIFNAKYPREYIIRADRITEKAGKIKEEIQNAISI